MMNPKEQITKKPKELKEQYENKWNEGLQMVKCPLNWTLLGKNVDKFNDNLILKAWKYGFSVVSLLCKLMRDMKTNLMCLLLVYLFIVDEPCRVNLLKEPVQRFNTELVS